MSKTQAPKQTKSAAEIIIADYTRQTQNRRQAQVFLVAVVEAAKAGYSQIIQIGNTVFLINKFNENKAWYPVGEGEVHIFVDESPRTMPERFAAFANTLRQMGYKKVNSFSISPAVIKMLERAKAKANVQIRVTQSTALQYGKMAPIYRIEVTL
jgi:hypothetical protein